MARRINRIAEAWPYVLEADRTLPPDQQTRFTLSPMPGAERQQVRDRMAVTSIAPDGTRTIITRTAHSAYEMVLDHVVSIENFPVGAPKPWPASREARATYLEQLPDDDVRELGNEIYRRSAFEGEDGVALGNSLPPALTPSSGGGTEA